MQFSSTYQYQYKVKIVDVPQVSYQETSVQTAYLCIELFSALGVAGIDVKDLDTAHRVPVREASNRPNTIICKIINSPGGMKFVMYDRMIQG